MSWIPAPVVLFVYARPIHTQRTLEALSKNQLARETCLYIYSDAPRGEDDVASVDEVRKIIRADYGFREVKIIERGFNFGLAKNIIEGVTEIFSSVDYAIVLEDDIVTSPYFLSFMNEALRRYQKNKSVWHVSAWNCPIDRTDIAEIFFNPIVDCWGWATWSDRWSHFEKRPEGMVNSWNKEKIWRFNFNGNADLWSQVVANYHGKISTWAVFWYSTIFEKDGFCISPTHSYSSNIGMDGTGENCAKYDIFKSDLNLSMPDKWPDDIVLDQKVMAKLSEYYRKNISDKFYRRIIRRIKHYFTVS